MRRFLAIAVLVLCCPVAQAAGLPYWICKDADGTDQVQDKPCANAPEAPPAGTINPPGNASEHAPGPATGITSWPYWREKIRGAVETSKALVQRGRESSQVQALIHDPWVWIGFVAFLLLLVVFWSVRGLYRSVYEWRDLRRARAAARAPVQSEVPLPTQRDAAPAAATPAVKPVAPGKKEAPPLTADRFTQELLGKLSEEKFSELCLRLWRMQGLRAAYDVGERLSDYPTILMQKPAAPKKPYGVCLCVPKRADGIGAAVVNELLSVMKERHCHYGSIMTPGDITMEARDRARGKSIELKGAITLMIEIEGLTDRQRRALLDVIVLGIEPPQNQRRADERIRLDPSL